MGKHRYKIYFKNVGESMCEGEIGVGWVFLRPPPVSLFIKVTPRKIDPLVRWMEEEEESSKVRLEEIGRDSRLNLLLILGRKSGGDFNACQNPFLKKNKSCVLLVY